MNTTTRGVMLKLVLVRRLKSFYWLRGHNSSVAAFTFSPGSAPLKEHYMPLSILKSQGREIFQVHELPPFPAFLFPIPYVPNMIKDNKIKRCGSTGNWCVRGHLLGDLWGNLCGNFCYGWFGVEVTLQYRFFPLPPFLVPLFQLSAFLHFSHFSPFPLLVTNIHYFSSFPPIEKEK